MKTLSVSVLLLLTPLAQAGVRQDAKVVMDPDPEMAKIVARVSKVSSK